MESKIKKLLLASAEMLFYAYRRRDWIEANDFQMAMYNQFMFLSLAEEVGSVKESMTNKEYTEYIKAMLCLDYK